MILIIEGKDKSAVELLADSLRNTAINQGKGALLIREHEQTDKKGRPAHETKHLLEKIIDGDAFPIEPITDAKSKAPRPGVVTPADKIKWKKDPQVILVGSGQERLKDLEALCPGFTKKFGPVSKMDLG